MYHEMRLIIWDNLLIPCFFYILCQHVEQLDAENLFWRDIINHSPSTCVFVYPTDNQLVASDNVADKMLK